MRIEEKAFRTPTNGSDDFYDEKVIYKEENAKAGKIHVVYDPRKIKLVGQMHSRGQECLLDDRDRPEPDCCVME